MPVTMIGRLEGVHKMARPAIDRRADPVVEPDTLFERRRGRAHEFALVDADKLQRVADRGEGAFADSDAADLVRCDQRDRQARIARQVEKSRKIGGGQPARGAAADDQDRAFRHWERYRSAKRFQQAVICGTQQRTR